VESVTGVTFYEISVAAHVMAAIVGFGPTFAFGLIQVTAEKAFPQSLPSVLRILRRTSKAIVNPVVALVGVTGIYQWIDGNWDMGSEQWLSTGFTLYLAIFLGALWVYRPSVMEAAAQEAERMVETAPGGAVIVKSERYRQIMRVPDIAGPIFGILTLVAVYLMVVKPF
jgi:hypothetical protein